MKIKDLYESVKFILIKLPLIYLLIVMGYLLELLVELPWLIRYGFDANKIKKQN
jgi:hypothetical protein